MKEEVFVNKILKGTGVSSGITTGNVYLLERGKIPVKKITIKDEQIEREVLRFKTAVKKAINELNSVKQSIPDDEMRRHAFIIDAHMLMLQDDYFSKEIVNAIKNEKINAEWALDMVVSRFLASFDNIEDLYLKERGQDLKYIYDRLLRILVKGKTPVIETTIKKTARGIIVAHDLSPADTIQLNLNKISGFVTDVGGRTSHTSIVARALEIPAVVGTGNITSLVKNNDKIILDGDEGIVIINPTREVQREYISKQTRLKNIRKEYLKIAGLKSETKDGFKIKVGANIELLAEMDIVERYGAQGIGLYRTEYIYLSRKTLPTEIEHFHIYKKLAENRNLEYITIRTLDIGGDKFASQIEMTKEINPAMGLRAIRLCIKEVGLFKAQLKGILRASAYGPLKLLIPMVSGLDEVRKTKVIIKECMEELEHKHIEFNKDIKIGIMIEVPSTCLISDILAKEIDFFSIGTNDLIQYTLAIDRGNEYVSYLYEPLHPAILRLIRQVVDVAHANEIEVAMCGEMAGEALYIPVLVGLGLDEISMNPYSVPRAKKIIRGIDHSYCKDIVSEIMLKGSPKEAEYMLRKEMARLFPQDFFMCYEE
ncbi:MAG TPA: phosphoenolpyruvate--protein phosphotransferase [Syntrophorhabdaceae bacterium]|nr:phosphoenolpyruvate--protein phosphotransferase [Syntrophorhabdaceae bacterium]